MVVSAQLDHGLCTATLAWDGVHRQPQGCTSTTRMHIALTAKPAQVAGGANNPAMMGVVSGTLELHRTAKVLAIGEDANGDQVQVMHRQLRGAAAAW